MKMRAQERTETTMHCTTCGSGVGPGDRFCRHCGQALARSAPPARRGDTPLAYTPRHLADRILNSRRIIAGERKQVTVLFADVQGSMLLAEQLDPEHWHQVMDRFFTILTDGVHRFEGTVNQYTGDGIMALFGAPLALEDHAQRACHAALHLRDELRRYGDALRVERGLSFSVRMGLNSGEVVVGAIGDDLRMDYTAIGHTVGLAARMEQLAEPGQALLTAHTARLVTGFFALRDLGAAQVKGVREPLRIYVLEAGGRLQTRFDLARARGLSRFVGRDAELATLEAALAEAVAGRGQVIAIAADPGVGKSRLCYEFGARCRARGITVFEAHGLAHGKAIPLLPWLEFMRGAFGISDADGTEAARDKIVGRMLRLDAGLDDAVPLMLDFLGVSDPHRPAPPMDADARQRQLALIVRRLMEARSARGEIAVHLMDDVQWFDAASETFLRTLLAATSHTRTLVIANFRPEYRSDWMAAAGGRRLALAPLGERDSDALLHDLLGDATDLRELQGLIRARTGGNPFFIEEAVRSLVEEGVLTRVADAGGNSRFALTGPLTDIRIPATVQALLSARIDRLAEHEKAVLQTAAVIGKRFTAPLLRRVLDVLEGLPTTAPAVAAALSDLAQQDLVHPIGADSDDVYAFKHPLTQEVAYRALLADRRARAHAAVARVLEGTHTERLGEHAAVLAHHWEAAGEPLEAARWHHRAAEWIGSKDRREAARHWKAAGVLLDGLPTTTETAQLGVLARSRRLLNAVYLGQPEDEQRTLFAEGRVLAAEHGSPMQMLMMSTSYGVARVFAGAVHEGVSELRAALRLADHTGDPTMRFLARASLVNPLHFSGRLQEALALSEEALALSDGDPRLGQDVVGFTPYVSVVLIRSLLLMRLGRIEAGREALAAARETARSFGDAEAVGTAHVFAVIAAQLSGACEHALDDARAAVEIAERRGSPFFLAGSHSALGYAYCLTDQWADGAAALEHALAIVAERRTGAQIEPSWLATLGDAYRALGAHDRALATAERALALARARGTDVWRLEALLSVARIRRSLGDIDNDLFPEAAALLEATGAASLAPVVQLEHAQLARLRGDERQYAADVRAAHAGFTAIGAAGHAARLAADLAGLSC
jgi:class 3 adenylate cyclase/tetratricopeptide (TPR) repeat protein